jgi:hypothetical protein
VGEKPHVDYGKESVTPVLIKAAQRRSTEKSRSCLRPRLSANIIGARLFSTAWFQASETR